MNSSWMLRWSLPPKKAALQYYRPLGYLFSSKVSFIAVILLVNKQTTLGDTQFAILSQIFKNCLYPLFLHYCFHPPVFPNNFSSYFALRFRMEIDLESPKYGQRFDILKTSFLIVKYMECGISSKVVASLKICFKIFMKLFYKSREPRNYLFFSTFVIAFYAMVTVLSIEIVKASCWYLKFIPSVSWKFKSFKILKIFHFLNSPTWSIFSLKFCKSSYIFWLNHSFGTWLTKWTVPREQDLYLSLLWYFWYLIKSEISQRCMKNSNPIYGNKQLCNFKFILIPFS